MSIRRTSYLAAGILGGSLLLGSVQGTFARAGKAAANRGIAAGQVAGLSGSTFTLTRTNKTTGQTVNVTVTLATNAKEKALKGTTGPLANGEYAVALGTKTTNGLSAVRVVYSTQPIKARAILRVLMGRALALRRHTAMGTYDAAATTAAGTGHLVLKNRKGTDVTFTLTATTKYRVNGQAVTTEPTFADGQKVLVRFKRDKATKTLTALGVATKTA